MRTDQPSKYVEIPQRLRAEFGNSKSCLFPTCITNDTKKFSCHNWNTIALGFDQVGTCISSGYIFN